MSGTEERVEDMGRKKAQIPRDNRAVKISAAAYQAVNILRGFTGEDFVTCLSRVALKCLNQEIAERTAAWQATQIEKGEGPE